MTNTKPVHIFSNASLFEHHDILIVQMNTNSKIEVADADEITAWLKDYATREKYGLLIDISQMLFISAEARSHFAKRRNPKFRAVAILLKSVLQRSFANLYFKFAKPTIPTQMFTDKDKASEWLQSNL